MEGQTLSHYRVLEKLGGGGMGVVYKALDTHLDRHVALKFLPPELTRDDDARERFVLEAKAASALDHPNICTVYDIDSTPDGQLFIAMGFYDGETLKKRIERGPLPIEEALDITVQIAEGLVEAHRAGIIHRDIKPANVMLTKNGLVKIVDFGIAKLMGVTGPTQTGTTLGTVSYMSPEQINGEEADQQTDVWALGAVLYEMLTGRTPFQGDRPVAVMNAIVQQTPRPLTSVRAEIPPEVEGVITRALQKTREARYESAGDLLKDVTDCYTTLTRPVSAESASPWRILMTPKVAVPVLLVAGLLSAGTFWAWNRGVDARWARAEAIPQVMQLADQGRFMAAFALAEQAAAIVPDDPILSGLWPRISTRVSLDTSPTGAELYLRDYADVDGSGRLLGTTPLADVAVPLGAQRWELRRDGFQTVTLATTPDIWQFPPEVRGFNEVILDEEGSLPEDMVRVPGGTMQAWLTGIDPFGNAVTIDEFFIDKYEVTNAHFKEFVDAGGYQDLQYWTHEFTADGQVLSRDDAMARFVDETGRPGPSTWELSDYPEGQGSHPVTGISWYEAAAYAEFTGKQLPSVVHWVRAAETRLFSFLLPLSNLEGDGVVPVGTHDAISFHGVHDMAGNVREWCWNLSGDERFILGGGWNDPAYLLTYASTHSPLDRSPTNGVRLVKYLDTDVVPETAAGPIEPLIRDYRAETPVADDVFQIYRDQFAYDQTDLNDSVEPLPPTSDDWVGERVTFDAAYGDEQVLADVYLPSGFDPPYQAVVMFPGSTAILAPSSPPPGQFDDFILRSGRALVRPIIKGAYERREDLTTTWPTETVRYAEYLVSWVKDVRRTIDYLETRDDIDTDRVAYYGVSWGGRLGAIIPAVEDRLKAAVLYSGGLASGWARPEVDQLNYISRVTIPTLMLNGVYDPIEPVDEAQRPMFELFGTPEADKKWVRYESGHVLPRNEVIRDTLDWLDTYLGPIN